MTGHELKVERIKICLKQIELAARSGIARERLSRFENGWQSLQPDELRRICEVLDQMRAGQQGRAAPSGAVGEQPAYTTEDHQ